MLIPVPGQLLPSSGSKKLIYFDCDCGNKNILKRWQYYCNGTTNSCGKCNLKDAAYWRDTKFGKLEMKNPDSYFISSNKEVIWKCDCGNETTAQINWVTSGNTTSCGRCNILPANYWANTKFHKLKVRNPTNLYPHSNTKIEWICDCGNYAFIPINQVTSKLRTSCGKCKLLPADYWVNMKFGKLSMTHPTDIYLKSSQKVEWNCDCGNRTIARVSDVTREDKGQKSCGKCNIIGINEIITRLKQIGSNLTPLFQSSVLKGSHRKLDWICRCGKTNNIILAYVLEGRIKTCGKCTTINSQEINCLLQNIGSRWRLKHDIGEVNKFTQVKYLFICNCGKQKKLFLESVTRGHSKSCGRCDEFGSEQANKILTNEQSNLRLENGIQITKGSTIKNEWTCACGNKTNAPPYAVMSGNTKSCGKCRLYLSKWVDANSDSIRELEFPIEICRFPQGGPILLENIQSITKPFKAQCKICKRFYSIKLSNLLKKRSLTCGCSIGVTSRPQYEIAKLIESIGLHAELEYRFGGYVYDIFVQSHKLIIEYNGLKWHAEPAAKIRDIRKYRNARNANLDYMCIFEDEWQNNKEQLKSLILNRLGHGVIKSERPAKCRIEQIDYIRADEFYRKYHYIGPCRAKINYGVYYQDQLVACMSIKSPTRQSKYQWELVRMASDPRIRIHGIWSKLLLQFKDEYKPKSIVSFSDNRLFNGQVYVKLGFHLNGEIRPDYYWVKGKKKFHKSMLRKNKLEKSIGTETELREAQGYKKIWDLGKKRWVILFTISHSSQI